MAAPVPAVERAVAILNLLASRPHEQLRASLVADTLRISKATTFSILACLTEAGLVSRDGDHKTYSLGPALVGLGAAARERRSGLTEAGDEIQQLSRNFGVECLVAVVDNDGIVAVDRAYPIGAQQPLAHVRPLTPLAPPAGLVYMSWSEPATFDDWLRRHGIEDDLAQEQYRRAAAVVRERGYAGGLENNQAQILDILPGLSDVGDERTRKSLAAQLSELLRHGANFISAPVFAPDGTVPIALSVLNPPEAIVGKGFGTITKELMAAAGRVTSAIGGTVPAKSSATTTRSAAPERRRPPTGVGTKGLTTKQ